MARYIEQTIESVLAQDYPLIEYIVMDGGSTDGTLEILDRYRDRIVIHSGPDDGTADAINHGLARASGVFATFLNADDYFLAPGAVSEAVRALQAHPEAAGVYGNGVWVDEVGSEIGDYPVADYDPERFRQECFICQPASLLRRSAFEDIGGLDAALRYTFDYDFWIRLSRGYPLARIPARLAASRMHRDSISLGSRRAVFRETLDLLRRHYGYVPFRWVHSYCSYRLDRRDQFFDPLAPGFGKYAVSLPVGLWHNRRHPLRYVDEWRRVMTLAGLGRRWKALWRGR